MHFFHRLILLSTLGCLLLFAFPPNMLFAQDNPEVEAAMATFNEGRMEKGIGQMEKALNKDPIDENWNVWVNMYVTWYSYTRSEADNYLSDAELRQMEKEGGHVSEPELFARFQDVARVCRKAGLYSRGTFSSQMLRYLYLDIDPDSNRINSVAQLTLMQGEDAFHEGDYELAKDYYLETVYYQPDYYVATFYVGEAYGLLNMPDSAIYWFEKARDMHPLLYDARKSLVETRIKYDRPGAEEECIQALLLYPEQEMINYYQEIIEEKGRTFDQHWIQRGSEVNGIGRKSETTRDKAWKAYQNGKAEIEPFCNSKGIITRSNTLTKAKYMEVYCWEKMLNEPQSLPPELEFAKSMQAAGWLDCYVFLSQFHFDLYDQYLHFATHNEQRMRTFMRKVWG